MTPLVAVTSLLLAGYFALVLLGLLSPSTDPQRGMANGFLRFAAVIIAAIPVPRRPRHLPGRPVVAKSLTPRRDAGHCSAGAGRSTVWIEGTGARGSSCLVLGSGPGELPICVLEVTVQRCEHRIGPLRLDLTVQCIELIGSPSVVTEPNDCSETSSGELDPGLAVGDRGQ